jgi:ferrous iron transport protein B
MKIALVGNPNSGKTTLFNNLTGANQSVGNWPGVTIEKKSGKLKTKEFEAEIIDLPGIYSLSTISLEEEIASRFVLERNADLIINIVDASN